MFLYHTFIDRNNLLVCNNFLQSVSKNLKMVLHLDFTAFITKGLSLTISIKSTMKFSKVRKPSNGFFRDNWSLKQPSQKNYMNER